MHRNNLNPLQALPNISNSELICSPDSKKRNQMLQGSCESIPTKSNVLNDLSQNQIKCKTKAYLNSNLSPEQNTCKLDQRKEGFYNDFQPSYFSK